MAGRRVRHRRGFIIFFGHRTLHRNDGTPPVEMKCPACAKQARIRGRYAQPWFTFYFLPIFPLHSRAESPRFSQCVACKQTFAMPIETFARRAGAMAGNDHASAIRHYNELRERPDDAETLLKLLAVYEAMNEPREAESSCRAFPAAFAADPRCAEAMRRIRAATTAAARPATA